MYKIYSIMQCSTLSAWKDYAVFHLIMVHLHENFVTVFSSPLGTTDLFIFTFVCMCGSDSFGRISSVSEEVRSTVAQNKSHLRRLSIKIYSEQSQIKQNFLYLEI
jgi:hypothetical protein